MRRTIGLLVLFVPLSLAALPAQAQTRAYAGLGAGLALASFNAGDFGVGLGNVTESADKAYFGFKAFAGAQFNKYIAAEIEFVDLGKFAYKYDGGAFGSATINYKVTGIALSALGIWPVSNDFSLFGRLGAFASRVTASLGDASGIIGGALSGGVSSSTVNKTTFLFGAGLQYDFSRSVAARFEYENFGQVGNSDDTGRAKVSLISASVLFLF